MLFKRIIGSDGTSIPQGLRPPAQGCEERATLGLRRGGDSTLKGLWSFLARAWSDAGRATTLSGLSHHLALFPRVARSSQPWALGRNPFGILASFVGLVAFSVFLSS